MRAESASSGGPLDQLPPAHTMRSMGTIGENDQDALRFSGAGVRNPPSAVMKVAELGVAWAEAVARRVCLTLAVGDWPAWPSFEKAKRSARDYAATLAWGLHVHRLDV